MDITVTVEPATFAVRLEATGATGQVDWFARRLGVDRYVGYTAGDGVIYDRQPDLNVTYEYVAGDDLETLVSAPVSVTATRPVLSSTTSAIATEVTVVTVRPYRGEGRSVWHPVLGRNDPLVTVHRALYPSGQLTLDAPTPSVREELLAMLDRGEPLLLRSTCAERVDTMQFIMTAWEDPFRTDGRKGGPAYLVIDYQQVTRATGIVPPDPNRTYQTVLDMHPTYQDILATWADYRALLDG